VPFEEVVEEVRDFALESLHLARIRTGHEG